MAIVRMSIDLRTESSMLTVRALKDSLENIRRAPSRHNTHVLLLYQPVQSVRKYMSIEYIATN